MENFMTHGKLLHFAKVFGRVHSLSLFINAWSGYSWKLRLGVFDHCDSDAWHLVYQFYQKAKCIFTLQKFGKNYRPGYNAMISGENFKNSTAERVPLILGLSSSPHMLGHLLPPFWDTCSHNIWHLFVVTDRSRSRFCDILVWAFQ